MVYRFVTRHTIEERILQLAKTKLALGHAIVAGVDVQDIAEKDSTTDIHSLNNIIKFGAKQIFAEEKDQDAESKATPNVVDEDKSSNLEQIMLVYDNDAIDKLLDRNQVSPFTLLALSLFHFYFCRLH